MTNSSSLSFEALDHPAGPSRVWLARSVALVALLPVLQVLCTAALVWLLLQAGFSFEQDQALDFELAQWSAFSVYPLYGVLLPALEVWVMALVMGAMAKRGASRGLAAAVTVLVFALFSVHQGWGKVLITLFTGLLFLGTYFHLRKQATETQAWLGVLLVYSVNNIASLAFIRF